MRLLRLWRPLRPCRPALLLLLPGDPMGTSGAAAAARRSARRGCGGPVRRLQDTASRHLIFPPHGGVRTLVIRPVGSGEVRTVRATLIPEAEREAALRAQSTADPRAWDYRIEEGIGIITMPTWSFWNQPFDWQA